MGFDKAKETIVHHLEQNLPSDLFYHGIHHTFDVFDAALVIAENEKIDSADDLTLLKTAALFHDSGFTIDSSKHEECGCDLAREILPACDYTNSQIDQICGMIMATKIPQQPLNLLERIICDADLDYLGRDDFFKIGDTLYQELKAFDKIKDATQWNQLQISFLSNHQYHTEFSRGNREIKKQENLQEIQNILSKG
ncbi:MAG: HD domain-containing protein [Bacteroidota bacterium]